ncbi:hypothetical protein EI42_05828 [Thermosporothrix hazakensis]|jgi:hypothetical protein|uniref:Uncharacterized protein n=1 Tax=Thermosporothrix hazakensis TaxID=644383 RepID=A0A326TWZ6_THEHA|nr:hypothetical protein [Thermosporothrix hazakensis]PZW20822.1 hypothetical protein EI42_05828 [Thermosporothrix hazakensis]GCE47523.1 hypothetical protein KTH_23920 [Thermosporothrix hazakensis]
MSNINQFGGMPAPRPSEVKLAQWLQNILYTPPRAPTEGPKPRKAWSDSRLESQLEMVMGSDYHLRFYQQLPDFIEALLKNEPGVTLRYASLLYHLAGCEECHQGYLELYDALSFALAPQETQIILTREPGTNTPPRMVGHLCRVLISQAEAVLKQARREHRDEVEAARSLLQLALRFSSRIQQSAIRRQATQDLVRVATLFSGPTAPASEDADTGVYKYTPMLATPGGVRGRKTVRHTELLGRPRDQVPSLISLQSRGLEGSIEQQGEMLELRLQGLGPELRGKHLLVTIPLGSLLEPVSWQGGNPLAIRSEEPVDAQGSLIMTLGTTSLRLSDPEEHNLLETLFLLLEVRQAE